MAPADPIACYLDSLVYERKLSKHTWTSYAHELAQLVTLADTQALNELTPANIREGVIQAHAQGLSARSIAHRLSVWRSFYRWLALHTALETNPVATVRAPKRARALPKALSVDDTKTMMEASQSKLPQALRDGAMVELFYSSGLRLAELINLDLKYNEHANGDRSAGWLDLPGKQVHVTGKGNRQRTVPIGSKAIAALKAWLAVRHSLYALMRSRFFYLRMAVGFLLARSSSASSESHWLLGLRPMCIHMCYAIRLPATYCNPVATCVQCRKCSAMRALLLLRFILH